MLYLIFIIELILLAIIIYKYSIINPISLGYIIFFIYGQSFFIDYLISGKEYLVLDGFDNLYVFGDFYYYITLLYFLFLVGYVFFPILLTSIQKKENKMHFKYSNVIKDNLYLLIVIIFLTIYLYITKDFTRYERIDWLQKHKIITMLINICTYVWVIYFLRENNNLKISYIFTIVFTYLAFYDGGRELLVLLVLAILFLKLEKTNSLYIILIGLLSGVFILIWKSFYVFILVESFNIDGFIAAINRGGFSLSNSDPKASIFLIASYFDQTYNEFYNTLGFTYIENMIGQFLRTFKIIDYPSLGERTATYFLDMTEKGKGLAFSGILESLLNFSYVGPFILGIILGLVTVKITDLKNIDSYKYKILSLFILIIILKLVRTEVAVVLKIYILPMMIAYFIVFKNSYTQKRVNEV